jgi:hypothetical protein
VAGASFGGSKQGDHYLRRILIVGAIAVLRRPGSRN